MHYCLIETELGWFGLAWSPNGITRAYLPGDSVHSLRERFDRFGCETAHWPPFIDEARRLILGYARGEPVCFDCLPLDLSGVSEFYRRVYDDILGLGRGETTTYGDIARRLGDVGLSRAVGQAMGSNPIPLIIPCHRVLASGGRSGGFSAPGGSASKMRMLALEGFQNPQDAQTAFDF
ncbi:methylated-DNA--[protein]-cysteine S-methyltransferase [Pseudomonas sp. ZM23]|uniref:Methylated-DNA--[protein]-cysteine S-methyltransferase n=1 Tax=Pseudomonas triclosanedens TaxID=2961893 RepID=A0ABY7A6S7_9PSED|nr:methylated-DNA--[protein]-cysteine S-methyltransferase [Pseudomonas triclosanedens]MCP8465742.1 methylated-DNA--[protein]-cysteine S-methyltransferase [Pseudomonas triclosanedens]MCP8471237.1 methylated-DNA--[protein]-cysteine S-methyltransferase [Pseudomonas triclosanedens]MCP8477041.1 methylated-DNA--[protein]-cysteine S-methyltransferase [Pseudomonas triclosanedens]WAI51850.1 methylated-DNA--[protein]-cysteine S-methyltransferase [Pseudomonas triclosanedens]